MVSAWSTRWRCAARGKAPVIKFTGLDIVNRNVSVGDPVLPSSLNSIDRLVLTHAYHTFSVYFSALSYANPGGNTYRYRLEGFDKAWHDAGKENRATYSNLPPGTYTLRVKAANSDGVWNEEGIALKIEVKPAWYASALMKALLCDSRGGAAFAWRALHAVAHGASSHCGTRPNFEQQGERDVSLQAEFLHSGGA